MKKILKILMILLIILVVIVAAGLIFIQLWPPFGARPSSEDAEQYARRAPSYFQNGKFHNLHPTSMWTNVVDPFADRAGARGMSPDSELPVQKPSFSAVPAPDALTVTWLGHSSLFIQMAGMNILVDPVLSDLCSPVSFVGTRRFGRLPVDPESLPHIDICIYSHDHYDHLDYNTVQMMDAKITKYIVPLGVENHLVRFGVERSKIAEMAWWESLEIQGLTVSCAPAQHFSGRLFFDSGSTSWASWVLRDERRQIFLTGDTGFSDHFEAIHERFGDMDLMMSDGAQYSVKWHDVHLLPEEAIEAAGIMGAKHYMPVHWGAFVLSNHAWDDPVTRQVRRAAELGIDILTPKIGQTLDLAHPDDAREHWWEAVQ